MLRRVTLIAAALAAIIAAGVNDGTWRNIKAQAVQVRHTGGPLARRLLEAPRLVAPVSAVTYIAFEQITVDSTAGGKGFTSTKLRPNGSGTFPQATIAQCRLETAEIRFTVDGTTVTSTVGTLLEIGDWLTLTGADVLQLWRGIRTGGSSGQSDCTYTQP